MFEEALTLLLSGEFVCAVRYAEAFRFLEQQDKREQAEAFLARLGRRLGKTKHGGAYYVVFDHVGPEQRKGIRDEFVEIKHNLRLLVGFFVHVMQALGHEEFLAPGSIIEANRLSAAIDDNPNLRSELRQLANLGKGSTSDITVRGMLDRLLKKMREEGYLVLANPEREIYEVTGKVEYLQEVVDFVMSYESIPDEVEEEPETGTLL